MTLHYYVGFCYVMLRRYPDAIRTFSSILHFIARTRQYHQRSAGGYDQVARRARSQARQCAARACRSRAAGCAASAGAAR